MTITNEQIEQFMAQAHRVGDAGLTICSSGNISWRIGDEVLLSGTGSWVPSLPFLAEHHRPVDSATPDGPVERTRRGYRL